MTKRRVAISSLAYYASDPAGFVEKAGAARNARAAQHGRAAHRDVIRPPVPVKALLVYCLALAIVLLVAYVGLIL